MAEIFNCLFRANSIANSSAKGLILDNKEGFYRDLGTSIFNDNDYVRIAFAYSFNIRSNPNNSTLASFPPESVTSNTLNNAFFMGFKTPNSNLPNESGTTKFCGLWNPPMVISSTRYTSHGGASYQALGYNLNPTTFGGSGIIAGSLTQPFTSVQAAMDYSAYPNSPVTTNVNFNWGSPQNDVSYIGIQLTNNNVMTFKYYTGISGTGNTQGPYLSALRNFINNETFTSSSITLTGGQYGNATAMFMYNPLNTTCIRVHAIAAAGFKN